MRLGDLERGRLGEDLSFWVLACSQSTAVFPVKGGTIQHNGIDKGWNDGVRDTLAEARRLNIDDVGFIKKMIGQLEKDFSIDPQKIYACDEIWRFFEEC